MYFDKVKVRGFVWLFYGKRLLIPPPTLVTKKACSNFDDLFTRWLTVNYRTKMIPDAETLLSGLEQSTHSDGGLRVSDGSDEILRQIKYLPKKRSRGNETKMTQMCTMQADLRVVAVMDITDWLENNTIIGVYVILPFIFLVFSTIYSKFSFWEMLLLGIRKNAKKRTRIT